MERRTRLLLILALLFVAFVGLRVLAFAPLLPVAASLCGTKTVIKFLRYQQRWIKDKSRFKVALKARQTGYTFATCYEVVEDCVARANTTWYYLSTNENRAKDAIADMARFAEVMKQIVTATVEEYVFEGEKFNVLVLVFPNKSRICGLAANPHTARGVHGNLVLDEFAHHQDPEGIWAAIAPVITRGFRVIVLSTPFGQRGKYYQIWEHGGSIWSRHRCDIYEAIEQGLKVNVEELRAFVNDDDTWAQEYECKFLDEASAWIPFDLIDAAENREATIELPDGFRPTGPCWLGVDIGRTRGLTVLHLNEQLGDVHWTRAIKRLKNTPISDQTAFIRTWVPMAQRCCIDKGVFGLAIYEDLQREFGALRVEGVQLTLATMEPMAVHLKQAFQDRRLRTPIDPDFRTSVHAVKQLPTVAGARFVAPVDKRGKGHADEFWALALALEASNLAVAPFEYTPVGSPRRGAELFPQPLFDDEEPGTETEAIG